MFIIIKTYGFNIVKHSLTFYLFVAKYVPKGRNDLIGD